MLARARTKTPRIAWTSTTPGCCLSCSSSGPEIFYVQLASEADQEKVLGIIAEHLPASARIFIGVTDPIDPRVETPEEVRDRVLAAARLLPRRCPSYRQHDPGPGFRMEHVKARPVTAAGVIALVA